METIVKRIKPLDWGIFWDKQEKNTQVLKVVASGLLSRKAVVMSSEKRNFQTLEELTQCMRASMLLPGVTGEVVRLKGTQAEGDNIEKTWWREWSNKRDSTLVPGGEPMSDAVVFEPIPYRSALRENCTHVIAIRTRADNISVTVKMGMVEKLIMSRYFGRKQGMPDLVSWMHNQYHKLVYAEDILLLNAFHNEINPIDGGPKVVCIALPAGTVPEVKRFETSRAVIFNSVRQGFAAAFDVLTTDTNMVGKGWEVAKEVYPESIMNDLPAHILLQIQEEEELEREKERLQEESLVLQPNLVLESLGQETRREEDIQDILSSTVGSNLTTSKRTALMSGIDIYIAMCIHTLIFILTCIHIYVCTQFNFFEEFHIFGRIFLSILSLLLS
jgi:hypothetical protein